MRYTNRRLPLPYMSAVLVQQLHTCRVLTVLLSSDLVLNKPPADFSKIMTYFVNVNNVKNLTLLQQSQ